VSFYFQLQPGGMGTAEVECLSSFLHRLADAHGASFYQLMAHLKHWRQSKAGRSLPNHPDSVRYNGYSRDVGPLVDSLAEATGLDTLRGCTLLALSDVCAGNSVGALKVTRAWCAACYQQAERDSEVIYDRLYWQIQGITRCFTHAVELRQKCVNCESVQKNNSGKTILSCCEHCGESLATASERSARASKPDLIEAQARLLLGFTSSNPSVEFSLGSFRDFSEELISIYTRRELIAQFGELFHARSYTYRMRLPTLLDFAARLNVSVVDILTEGALALSQAAMPFESAPRANELNRPRTEWEKRDRAYALLLEAVRNGPPYPSAASIAALAGISQGLAAYHYNSALAEYAALRRKRASDEREARTETIIRLANVAPEMRTLPTVKAKERWLSEQSGAPIFFVRRVLSANHR